MNESRVDALLVEGLQPEPSVLTNDIRPSEDLKPNTVETDIGTEDIQQDTEEPVYQDAKEEPKETKQFDDYGIEVVPKAEKTYTEAEVQAMIRDRLSRGRQAEPQPQVTPVQQQNFQYDDSSNESWETQLESFIENTLSKREQKQQERVWKQREEEAQAQFEIRFNQGAAKYNDFEQVVIGKPLTAQMVVATRGMQDPAAFIYAAAKTQAPELERISRLNDPYQQAVELGRLEERMRKTRSASSSPKPIDMIKSDIVEREERPKARSIDDKIVADERNRINVIDKLGKYENVEDRTEYI